MRYKEVEGIDENGKPCKFYVEIREKKKYCLLIDGSIECLYQRDDNGIPILDKKRCVYEKNGKWYLDHDKWVGKVMVRCHDEIIEFLTEQEARAKK